MDVPVALTVMCSFEQDQADLNQDGNIRNMPPFSSSFGCAAIITGSNGGNCAYNQGQFATNVDKRASVNWCV
jgi:hypothetical protein